jgi:hypothetical protein
VENTAAGRYAIYNRSNTASQVTISPSAVISGGGSTGARKGRKLSINNYQLTKEDATFLPLLIDN